MIFTLLTCLIILLEVGDGSHFRGGDITWAPVQDQPNQITVTWRLSWRLSKGSRFACEQTTIDNGGIIGEGGICESSNCIDARTPCTDFNSNEDWSSGTSTSTISVSGTHFTLVYTDDNWITLQNGGGDWYLKSTVDLSPRPDGNGINTPPTTGVSPVKVVTPNSVSTFRIAAADSDGDNLRCRWGDTDIVGVTEPPDNVLSVNETTCTITFTAGSDGIWAIAMYIEDFINSSSTTPLSAIPVQFLIDIEPLPGGCTADKPDLISPSPDDEAEITVVAQKLFTAEIRGDAVSASTPITDFTTLSPRGLTKSSLISGTGNEKYVNITWTPGTDQIGPYIFCFAATDSCQSGDERCVTLNVQDFDECAENTDNCDVNAMCNNIPGNFTCSCNGGWTGDGVTCTDIDECVESTDNCDDVNAMCNNIPGNYTCSCNGGWTGDGVTCTDIDECGEDTDNCDVNAMCSNNPGSFDCTCNGGYTGNGVLCNDIDECAESTDNCDVNAMCSNNVGSFNCTCNVGYTGNGVLCNDIDECADDTDNCDMNAICSNNPGSFNCTCNGGYTGNGVICNDIDECADDIDNCDVNAMCSNNPGSFTCSCNGGYTGDGVICNDIDECGDDTDNCDVNATCSNNPGSFNCTCNGGYTGNGVTCNDIDECVDDTDNCDVNAICSNNPGSFNCTCNGGYTGNGVLCNDIDECADDTDNCDVNATCSNNPGSFICTCYSGYTGDGVICNDEDPTTTLKPTTTLVPTSTISTTHTTAKAAAMLSPPTRYTSQPDQYFNRWQTILIAVGPSVFAIVVLSCVLIGYYCSLKSSEDDGEDLEQKRLQERDGWTENAVRVITVLRRRSQVPDIGGASYVREPTKPSEEVDLNFPV